jgi:hypothetical protein
MSTLSRFPGGAGKDNTSRILTNDVQSPAYASSLVVTVKKANTLVTPGTLTGNLSLTANVGTAGPVADDVAPFKGDYLEFIFTSDASIRTITFSTGFASAGTLATVASKKAFIAFVFDGTAWVEAGRAIGA